MPDSGAGISNVSDALAYVGALAAGIAGKLGYDVSRRRSRNGKTDLHDVVEAIRTEASATRKTMHDAAEKHNTQLAAMAAELAVIKDRLVR